MQIKKLKSDMPTYKKTSDQLLRLLQKHSANVHKDHAENTYIQNN